MVRQADQGPAPVRYRELCVCERERVIGVGQK